MHSSDEAPRSLRILYLHQYFITPGGTGGARSYYLSKVLAERGHDVEVVTSDTSGQAKSRLRREKVGDVTVTYINNRYAPGMGTGRRILSFLGFMIQSSLLAFRMQKADIVFASSTPLTIGLPALIASRHSKTRFVLELRDLWPDVPYELGVIRSRNAYRLLKRFENYLYRKADHVITISQGITDLLAPEIAKKTTAFPFGSNLQLFSATRSDDWKTLNGITAQYLIVYTGAIGVLNEVDTLVEAANALQDRGTIDFHLAIVGEGRALEQIRALVHERADGRVSLHAAVPVEQVPQILASADIGVILFSSRSQSYRYTASPNKLFDYLAAGLPCLFNFEGPTRELLEHSGCGLAFEAGSVTSLVDALDRLLSDPQRLEAMRTQSRETAEKNFDRNEILLELSKQLEALAPGSDVATD